MTEPVSEQELADIASLAAHATPGPWYVQFLDDDFAMNMVAVSTASGEGIVKRFPHFDCSNIVAATLIQHPRYADIADGLWDENAKFIAACRDLVPRLVAEVRRLRGELTR